MIEHDLNLYTRTRCPVCDGEKVISCEYCNGAGWLWSYPPFKGFKDNHHVPCSICKGRGYVICPRCHGSGEDTHADT